MTQVIGLRGYAALEAHARSLPLRTDADAFIFVRHGETEGNRTRIFQVPHIPLNAAGQAQAQKAAQRLAGTPLTRIIASPMTRAWQTASTIGDSKGLVPQADGALSERYYVNLWDTPVPADELDWGEDPPGCETLAAFVSRVAHGLNRILADTEAAPHSAIVAHGGILLILCALTGVTLADDQRRNAVPLRFRRASAVWTAEAIG